MREIRNPQSIVTLFVYKKKHLLNNSKFRINHSSESVGLEPITKTLSTEKMHCSIGICPVWESFPILQYPGV